MRARAAGVGDPCAVHNALASRGPVALAAHSEARQTASMRACIQVCAPFVQRPPAVVERTRPFASVIKRLGMVPVSACSRAVDAAAPCGAEKRPGGRPN